MRVPMAVVLWLGSAVMANAGGFDVAGLPASVGHAFDGARGEALPSVCVVAPLTEWPAKYENIQGHSEFELATSRSELARSLQISARARAKMGSINASAAASYYHNLTRAVFERHLFLRATAKGDPQAINGTYTLTPAARELSLEKFREFCGDSFAYARVPGRYLHAIWSKITNDSTEATNFEVSAQAAMSQYRVAVDVAARELATAMRENTKSFVMFAGLDKESVPTETDAFIALANRFHRNDLEGMGNVAFSYAYRPYCGNVEQLPTGLCSNTAVAASYDVLAAANEDIHQIALFLQARTRTSTK